MTSFSAPDGYEAARASAAWFAPEGGRFRLIGPDGQDFLHRMVTNEVRALSPGQGVYALMLDINGRMIADLHAWLLSPDNLLIETALETVDTLTQTLDRYIIMEQVEIQDVRESLALASVQGPGALQTLRDAGLDVPDLTPMGVWSSGDGPEGVVVAARDRSGRGGFDIYAAPERMSALEEALSSSGAVRGSDEALEILRVEAGIPKWSAELTESVIPLEANLEGVALSFTKGCYPGQEIIARIHSRGRPAKHLTGIRFEGSPPEAGTPVERDDAIAGNITSAVASPTLGGIALGYMRHDSGEPGTEVTAGGLKGITSSLPFEG